MVLSEKKNVRENAVSSLFLKNSIYRWKILFTLINNKYYPKKQFAKSKLYMLTSKSKTSTYKLPMKTSKIKDCPYCKSTLTETEKDFFPCTCSFQACIECYKDIIHNKNLCPTCHNPLRLEKLNALHASRKEEYNKMNRLSKADVDRLMKKEASKKTTTVVVTAAPGKRTETSTSIKVSTHSSNESSKFNLKKMSLADLFKVRVLQRNLVYVIGLAPKIAKSDILDKFEYFGQYGKIQKIIVNKNNAYNPSSINGPSYSAYITFANDIEASIAILAVDQFDIYERTIRASYGTTKYCTFFLRDQACPNPDCLYLHRAGNERDSFMKDEANSNKNVFIDQQKMAVEYLQKYMQDIEKSIIAQKNAKTTFPSLTIVKNKVREFIAQNAQKEKIELKKDPIKPTKIEEEKSASKDKESNAKFEEKKSILEDKTETETKGGIDESTPTKSRQEEFKDEDSRGKELSEPYFQSERSSVSGQSGAENGYSAKKEPLEEEKDQKIQTDIGELGNSELDSSIKPAQEDENSGEIDNTRDALVCIQQMIRSFSRDNKEDEQQIQGLAEAPYHSEFDKRVLEKIFSDWTNHTSSRFSVAQEDNEESSDEIKLEGDQRPSDFDIEFNVIYKSIQDYVHLPTNSANQGAQGVLRKPTEEESLKTYSNWEGKEPFKFEGNDIKNTKSSSYSLFNGAFNQSNAQNGLKVTGEYIANENAAPSAFSNDQNDDSVHSGADMNTSPDKKGSNSKTKKGKSKRKKGSNSKNNLDANITTNSVKGTNGYTPTKGLETSQ